MIYNFILRQLTLRAIKVVVAPYLLLMKFKQDASEVVKLSRSQKIVRECYLCELKVLRK